jgi:hypothetical protein
VRTRADHVSWSILGIVALSACVDGDPAGLPGRTVAIDATPVFALAPTDSEIASLDLIRVKLHGLGDTPRVIERSIDPFSEEEWAFDLTVEVDVGRPLQLYLETELVDVNGGTESVEWSGRTDPFEVRATFEPQELRQVDLYRGPLANLGLTGVEFGASTLRLVEGTTATLSWTLSGDTVGTSMYLRTLDSSVASVGLEDRVRGERSGSTKVLVYGGMVADTVDLTVAALELPTLTEMEATLMPQLDYAASELFVASLGDPSDAMELRTEMGSLSSALRELRGADVIRSYESTKATWRSYGRDSGLREPDLPQLGVVELALILVANTLRTGLP